MIPISTELDAELKTDVQIVKPNVLAHMSDMRYMANISAVSSSHSYSKQILDKKPQVYLKLNKTDYNIFQDTISGTIGNANPGVITCINHGLIDGTPVLISGTTTFPSNLSAGELFCKETFYYVEVINTHQFYLHTTQASAISGTVGGRIDTSGTTTNKTVTISITDPASYTDAVFTCSSHGLNNGDAVTIRTLGTLPTASVDNGISTVVLESTTSTVNIFYVQNASTDTFNLNITKTGAISNDDTGKVKTTGSQSGIHNFWPIFNFTFTKNGSHRVKDYGLLGFDVSLGTNGSSATPSVAIQYPYTNPLAPPTIDSLPVTSYRQIIEPKRLIDTFNRSATRTVTDAEFTLNSRIITSANANFTYSDVGSSVSVNGGGLRPNSTIISYINESTVEISRSARSTVSSANLTITANSLGFFTSSTTSDKTMSYYSWRTHGKFWKIDTNNALISGSSSTPAYLTYNTTCFDHYIDVKFGNTVNGQGAVLRYIDDDNYIAFYYTGTAFRLIEKCNGNAVTIATSSAHTLSTSNYYRFEASYNTFTVYNMGTTEPTSTTASSLGTSILSRYIDTPKFRTSDATSVGVGNYFGEASGARLDYAAIQSFDYLGAYSNFAGTKYAYATVENTVNTHIVNKNLKENLQKLSSYSNFTYSFVINLNNTNNRGIFALGDLTTNAIYIETVSSGMIKITISDGTTSYSVTSTTTLTTGSDNHIAIIKQNENLLIYINNVFDNSISNIPTSFSLYTSTSNDLSFRVGSGISTSNTYINAEIGEFCILDYALSVEEVSALYNCLISNSTFPIETTDYYFNVDNIVDRFAEETFIWGVTNSISDSGDDITVSGHVHAVGTSYILDPEYSKFSLATVSNGVQPIVRDNYGWMSRCISNASAVFDVTDSVTITFDSLKCNKIFFSTGYLTGAIDDFDLSVTTADESVLALGSFSFSGSSIVYVDLLDVYDIIKITFTPLTTVNPNDNARLYCINPIWEVDLTNYVTSFSINKVRENYESSIPIGATSANSGSITLDNTNLDFNPYGASTYGNYIFPDTKLFLSFDHEITRTQQIENVPVAYEVYADNWTLSNSSMQVDVKFRDYSKYLQEETIKGYLSQGLCAGRSIADILMESGFPKRKIYFIDKFEETVFLDSPKVFMPFNETQSEVNDLGLGFRFQDYCGLVVGDSSGAASLPKSGTPIVYSDLLSVQDDSARYIDDYAYQIFTPENKLGSTKVGLTYLKQISNESNWKPIGYNDNNDWTFSFCHFLVDLDPITSTSTYYSLFQSGGASPDCRISFRFVDSDTMYYRFSMVSASSVEYTITSGIFDPKESHLIHIKKTSYLSPPRYDLFVDGVKQGSIAPTVTGTKVMDATFFDNTITSYISNFLYYDYALTDARILDHYKSFSISVIPTFKYLSAAETTYWDAMLNIATADLGMFYFDEYGNFQYEYRNFKHEDIFERYQVSQYAFSDEVNIIEGGISTEIQTNKVNVKVSQSSTDSNLIKVLWTAPEGESLAITRLTEDLSLYSEYITLENVDKPIWLPAGYVKIDDEIIKYQAIKENKLFNLERGAFGTEPSAHSASARAREARFYSAQFTETPATIVKYPIITAEISDFENSQLDIDFYYSTPFETQIMLSAKDPGEPIYFEDNIQYYFKRGGKFSNVVVLQGTDPTTGSSFVFEIAGLSVTANTSTESIAKISSLFSDNIRKYRVKEITFENPFIENRVYAKIVADYILSYYSNPVKVLNLSVLGVPHLQLGDLVTIEKFEQLGIVDTKFWVIQIDISYDGSIRQDLVLHQYSDTVAPPEIAASQNLVTGEISWGTSGL